MNISIQATTFNGTLVNRSATADYIDSGQKLFFCALLALESIFGTAANLMIILVIVCTAFLRTLENAFVVNLAFADFLISFVTQPSSLVVIAQLCLASCQATNWNTLLIAINRYILICHPQLYPRVYTRGNVFLMCVTVWGVMLLISLPNHIDVGWGTLGFSDTLFVCTFAADHYPYTLFIMAGSLFFPAVVTFSAYYGIYRQVRMSRIRVLTGRPGKSLKKSVLVAKSLFKAYVVYLLLVLPFGVVMVLGMGPRLPHIWYMLTLLLYHGVGTANCFVYAARLGKFWDGLRLMLRLPMKSDGSGTSGQMSNTSQRSQKTASLKR
ncbi:melatonin receptor type 1B-A-like [Paramacrobiotus metropolitanus]|uniref:melatonin receptor type 1B-A-like n=1 Tax=Paramacrobiotus metropolitanus TaxID=2943436 RepID=UPI0024459703|nr:melatonin receptor type 1B-A-like [Paramacrobiotus metropolitanus]